MNTLQEIVRQRREVSSQQATENALRAPGAALRVVASDGGMWAFPWTHFIFLHAIEFQQREVMSIVFAVHEVVVFGQYLARLVENISEQRSNELRVSKDHYNIAEENTPIIETIEILVRQG